MITTAGHSGRHGPIESRPRPRGARLQAWNAVAMGTGGSAALVPVISTAATFFAGAESCYAPAAETALVAWLLALPLPVAVACVMGMAYVVPVWRCLAASVMALLAANTVASLLAPFTGPQWAPGPCGENVTLLEVVVWAASAYAIAMGVLLAMAAVAGVIRHAYRRGIG